MLIEPWMETDPVEVVGGGGGGEGGGLEVKWEGSSRWVEVTIGLLGDLVSGGGGGM